MHFDLDKLSVKNTHKLMISVIAPRPIAWVVSQNEEGQLNAAPFSFFNIVADDPPLIGISVGGSERGVADYKDTARNIQATGEFVVNIVSRDMMESMIRTGVDYNRFVNELEVAGLATLPSTTIKPPRIAGSPASLECTRFQILDFAAHRQFIIGRVNVIHIKDDAVMDQDQCYIDAQKLDSIGRMHGAGWYTEMKTWFQMRTPPRVD